MSRNPARLVRDKGAAPPLQARSLARALDGLRTQAEGIERDASDKGSELCALAA